MTLGIGMKNQRFLARIIIYLLLGFGLAFALFPLAWMVSTSLKTDDEIFNIPPNWVPQSLTFEAYFRMWTSRPLLKYFTNSGIVTIGTTLLSISFAALAGYGFSRFKFRGHKLLLTFVLISQMLPYAALVIPYFTLFYKIRLINTYPALIIAYTSFALPFCTWMLKGFFDSIPKELDEAALIDGCSRIGVFLRIGLPLALPGIAATMIFSSLLSWNHFLFALCLTTHSTMHTVPVAIASFVGEYQTYWNQFMASALVASFPVIVLFAFLEKYLVQGLTAGAVKG